MWKGSSGFVIWWKTAPSPAIQSFTDFFLTMDSVFLVLSSIYLCPTVLPKLYLLNIFPDYFSWISFIIVLCTLVMWSSGPLPFLNLILLSKSPFRKEIMFLLQEMTSMWTKTSCWNFSKDYWMLKRKTEEDHKNWAVP